MNLTIKPFGAIDPTVLEHLRQELGSLGQVSLSPAEPVPASFTHREKNGAVQYLASEFERAVEAERGDRILAVTDVDLYDGALNFVFGHAMIRDRYAVISVARFGNDGRERLFARSAKTAVHELGHTLGLHHDDANPECVMHFSEKLEDTDRKGRTFCTRCGAAAAFTLSRLKT